MSSCGGNLPISWAGRSASPRSPGRSHEVSARLLNLTAFISVSIGLINLFPIPLLDGGHLLFYADRGGFGRKPLSERTQEIGFRIGLAIVLMFMIFAIYNDRTIIRGMFSWNWVRFEGP